MKPVVRVATPFLVGVAMLICAAASRSVGIDLDAEIAVTTLVDQRTFLQKERSIATVATWTFLLAAGVAVVALADRIRRLADQRFIDRRSG